ncbi:MAG: inorganic diphosphatase [Patulibacter minatonensis]
MTDDKGQDDKIVCIPTTDPNWTDVNELDDLSDQLKTEIAHFFEIYKQPEGKTVTIDGWGRPREGTRGDRGVPPAVGRGRQQADPGARLAHGIARRAHLHG